MSAYDMLLDAGKHHAAAQDAQTGLTRVGTVTSYDPSTGTAKVELQPEGTLTSWLPVASQWIGNGWGMHSPLLGGEAVHVVMQEGDSTNGIVVGRAWTDQMQPPATPAGEMWMVHQTGAVLKLQNTGGFSFVDKNGASMIMDGTGKCAITDQHGTSLTFQNNGEAFLNGNLVVSGDITDRNRTGGTSTLNEFRAAYNAHLHPQGDDSAGDTEPDTGTTTIPV